jgi:hypothetical protein
VAKATRTAARRGVEGLATLAEERAGL